jgi:hypothetical protein
MNNRYGTATNVHDVLNVLDIQQNQIYKLEKVYRIFANINHDDQEKFNEALNELRIAIENVLDNTLKEKI